MKIPYQTRYYPPIPTLSIRLYSQISDSFSASLPGLVDTGSDATLIPMSHLIQLAAEETATGWLVSITGERKPVSLYFVDIYVGSIALSGIRVIGDKDAGEVILGRDVLNKLSLLLDGPQSTLTLLDDKTVRRLRRE